MPVLPVLPGSIARNFIAIFPDSRRSRYCNGANTRGGFEMARGSARSTENWQRRLERRELRDASAR